MSGVVLNLEPEVCVLSVVQGPEGAALEWRSLIRVGGAVESSPLTVVASINLRWFLNPENRSWKFLLRHVSLSATRDGAGPAVVLFGNKISAAWAAFLWGLCGGYTPLGFCSLLTLLGSSSWGMPHTWGDLFGAPALWGRGFVC